VKVEVTLLKTQKVQPGLYFFFIGIISFLFVHYFPGVLQLIPPCQFREWSGIPCPTCGATRVGVLLGQFQFYKAFLTNPLFSIIYMAIAGWGLYSVLALFVKRQLTVSPSAKEKMAVKLVILLSIPVNWLYMIIYQFVSKH
jgi:hypothetical protein